MDGCLWTGCGAVGEHSAAAARRHASACASNGVAHLADGVAQPPDGQPSVAVAEQQRGANRVGLSHRHHKLLPRLEPHRIELPADRRAHQKGRPTRSRPRSRLPTAAHMVRCRTSSRVAELGGEGGVRGSEGDAKMLIT